MNISLTTPHTPQIVINPQNESMSLLIRSGDRLFRVECKIQYPAAACDLYKAVAVAFSSTRCQEPE